MSIGKKLQVKLVAVVGAGPSGLAAAKYVPFPSTETVRVYPLYFICFS